MRLGLALGSGGARGWAHVGVLLGLRDLGVQPDVVAGSSMGALIGAVWAADRLDEMEAWARAQTRADILKHMDFSFTGGGLMRGSAVMRVLTDLGVPDSFGALTRPLIVVATDLASGREVWLQQGSVYDAVRGSVSIPGVVSPHWHEGKWLLDGGLTNPVPASACRALGADVTIAVNPNAKPENALWSRPPTPDSLWDQIAQNEVVSRIVGPLQKIIPVGAEPSEKPPLPPSYAEVVSVAIDIMAEFVRKARAASDSPHLTLSLDLGRIGLLDMHRAGEAIDEGRALVSAHEAQIRALCPSA
ncbi:MAG: patatin-like phospholipase family protein [Paracoccaceae bacterium]|jgi:NTE family protein|nr:patatin-like phospholipase family protein [Paracoccaceae bacterium]MDM7970987.1 patatin-like phospholipase family protein [Paracoccaceae bacterium]